jgi:hypothetical protein
MSTPGTNGIWSLRVSWWKGNRDWTSMRLWTRPWKLDVIRLFKTFESRGRWASLVG